MKQILSLLLFILLTVTAKAQLQLDDFYRKGATWCQIESHSAGQGTYWGVVHPHYEIGDDTMFNGHTYHKFLMDGSNDTKGCIRVSNDTVFFVRTYNYADTTAFYKKVFQRTPFNTETILYKFNLQVGDSLDWKYDYKTVTKIDTVYLSNGQPVRQYYFEGGSQAEWIEGIGGATSFFSSFMSYCTCWMSMIAYTNHDFGYNFVTLPLGGIWGPVPYDVGVCFPTSITNPDFPKYKFHVYPNPLTDNTLHITSIGIERLSVVDMTGKEVYVASHLPSGDKTINLNLVTGIYILKVQLADGSIEIQKIVKQ